MKRRDITLIVIIILAVAAVFKFFPPGGAVRGLPSENELVVHFIDVGQGDCALIQHTSVGVLIDAGEAVNGPRLARYLRDAGIARLEYAIATHPHNDHIGGMAAIVSDFDVGHVVMPDAISTTATFERLRGAVKAKGLPIEIARPGENLDTGISGLTLEILAPNGGEYTDENEFSVVIRAVYGATSFLFTADASRVSEAEMRSEGFDLSADVLKAGHHGSTTSTTPAFLEAVDPRVAVIPCGKDNPYGHPASAIVNRLSDYGARIYRTDLNGTIRMVSDGTKIAVYTEK